MRTCPRCRRTFVATQDACPLDGSALAPDDGTPPAPDLGRVVGSYRLIGLIGEGGMSTIYVGAHTRLKRHAAIKVLKPALQRRPEAVARFLAEARTLHEIAHPNIVASLDLVQDGAYCVLELLDGPSLAHQLRGGRLPIATALHIAAQLADALAAVHARGIVHRDLTPANVILLARDGRENIVKLIDFGVAQIGADATSQPVGTAAYMAPEQAAGERVDGRADLYALGVILFEMVTGQHPFPSTNDHEATLRHADDEPPVLSSLRPLPRTLDAIVLRCLAKRPADRYPDAAALAAALRRVTPRRRHLGWVVGAAAAAALAIAVVSRDDAAPPPRAPVVVDEPPAPPPIAATITLAFRSEPSGARVFRAGETVPLGVTPFETTLARAERSTTVRFELSGYAPQTATASLAEHGTVAVTLDKLPVPIAVDKPPAPKPKRKPEREGVLDPFGD